MPTPQPAILDRNMGQHQWYVHLSREPGANLTHIKSVIRNLRKVCKDQGINLVLGFGPTLLKDLTNDVPNDGFSESLDASIGGATGNATTNSGSFSLLAAGGTNASALAVGIDTSSAGHKVGTATITLTSNGAGTSDLGTTGLGTQTVNVSGNVYRYAEAGAIAAMWLA